jgi:putative transcriptional regulator
MKRLIGRVLISEPFIQDPSFERSVVLMTDHNEEGSVGFVLNQKSDHLVSQLVPDLGHVNLPVYVGGPVELDGLHCIHSYSGINDSVALKKGLFWSGDFGQIIAGLKSGAYEPSRFKFFMGYSGWSKGQLVSEISEKSWIIGDIPTKIIFNNEMMDKNLWKYAIRLKGGKDALLANSPSNPLLN